MKNETGRIIPRQGVLEVNDICQQIPGWEGFPSSEKIELFHLCVQSYAHINFCSDAEIDIVGYPTIYMPI